MKSANINLYLVEDCLKDIQQLDSLISLNQPSSLKDLMVKQYEARKMKVFSELISHLIESSFKMNEPQTFFYIEKLIERFYPEASQRPKDHPELQKLDSVLAEYRAA